MLFAVELDRRWAADGIRGYAVHPGVILGTDLGPARPEDGPEVNDDQQRAMGLIDDSGRPIIDPDRGTKTPQQGASTSVFAATSPLLASRGGVYCEDCNIASVETSVSAEVRGVRPWAIAPDLAERLWALSADLTGVPIPAMQ